MRRIVRHPLGRVILIAAGVIVVAVAALAGYVYITGGSGQPGGNLAVPTLPPDPNSTTFTIVQSGTKASFSMSEVLFGRRHTVVGTTDQVAGQIQVDFQNPAKSRVGEIKVDVNTLVTDSDFRNRALRGQILESTQPQNQFAIFVPGTIAGLPATITVGQTISFQLTGDLTIHGVTHTVTFSVQVTIVSQTKLTGIAQTTVKYADYNIRIPNVPGVANVSQTTQIELDFTAQQ